jgi:putative cell wall-binding protein
MITILAFVVGVMPATPGTAVAIPAPTTTWYVNASATSVGTGTVADPFRSITSALAVVEPDDSIVVAPGTYGAYETFPLEINGGWYDIYSTGGSARTIINGGGAAGPLIEAYDAGFSLDGFTITGATRMALSEIEPNGMPSGGGMVISSCEADLSDLVISDNLAYEGAGLSVVGYSQVLLADSVISGNGSHSTLAPIEPARLFSGDGTLSGGGISVRDSSLELDGCTITGNKADYLGAGIYAYNADLEVYDSFITNNVLADTPDIMPGSLGPWGGGLTVQDNGWPSLDGGGVYGEYSSLGFVRTKLSGNVGAYGAIAANWSELFVDQSVVSGHAGFAAVGFSGPAWMNENVIASTGDRHASPGDSAMGSKVGRPTGGPDVSASVSELGAYAEVDRTLFTGNTVETAFIAMGGVAWLNNDLFIDNTIEFPTVAFADVYGDVAHCTLYGNGSQWGVWSQGEMADMWIENSIVWDGQDEYSGMHPQGSSSSIVWSGALGLYYDDLKSGPEYMGIAEVSLTSFYDEAGLIYEDPRFMDAPNGDFRLALGSPCVDGVTGDWGLEDDFAGNWRPQDGNEDGTYEWDMGAYEYTPGGRFGSTTRYTTAIQVVEQNFDSADTVVIATGERFPDGLSASALCGLYDAPLLLTPSTVLIPEVVAEIERLGATRAFIVGGRGAVGTQVESALVGLGMSVTRLGGIDRYETASIIARHVIDNSEFNGMVFMARGDNFADALAVAPVAYSNVIPVLLVRPDRLPASTVDVLRNYGVTSAAVLGGPAAVRVQVEAGVQKSLGVTTERIGGADRYATAALISEWAYDNGLATFEAVGMATGLNFPDALCGGPGIGTRGGVLLLTPSTSLSPAAAAALNAHSEEVDAVQFFGGTVAISDAVKSAVYTVLGW